MSYRPKVYTASKLERAQLWITMRNDPDWAFCDFTSTWVDKVMRGEEATSGPTEFAYHWSRDFTEIRQSDFVLLWGRDQPLRGALVECGACIAYGGRVVTVGLPPEHTWSYHPSVTRCENLVEARNHLYQHTIMVPPASTKRKDLSDDQ